ncbi:hypothetical protein O9929_24525 [Vibrio lentus]|nr:hypothetical protein [Vibrio lentus]
MERITIATVLLNEVFGYVGHKLFQALWHWAVRRHPTKSKTGCAQIFSQST